MITQNDTSTTSVTEKKGFLYARVSSNKQKEVSTSKEMDLKPYWNDQVKEWSQKLWLPTVTDSADLHLTSLNICSRYTLRNSWFSSTNQVPTSMNYHKISLQSTPSLSVEYREEEQLNTEANENQWKIKTIKTRSKKKRKIETT
ncbi:3782_t:CDS:2, partial [Cetraspora pellucida]